MTETERKVINYYNKGYTIKTITQIMPLNRKEISSIIKKYPDSIQREKAISGNRAILISAIDSGISDIRVLQEMTGYAKNTIYTYVRVGRRKPHYNHGHTAGIISELQSGQMSQSDIARKYNVSRQAVHKYKKYL